MQTICDNKQMCFNIMQSASGINICFYFGGLCCVHMLHVINVHHSNIIIMTDCAQNIVFKITAIHNSIEFFSSFYKIL